MAGLEKRKIIVDRQLWVVTRQRKLLSPLVFLKGYKFLMK